MLNEGLCQLTKIEASAPLAVSPVTFGGLVKFLGGEVKNPPVPTPANPPSINSPADTNRSLLPPPIYLDSIEPTAVIQLCVALSPDTGTLGI